MQGTVPPWLVTAAPFQRADTATLAANVLRGQRQALAKSITLVESDRTDDQARAAALLGTLMPRTGASLRLGISGAPGVGKSSVIEALGMYLIGQGHRVAVLAIDPSSARSGGSVLGDKTRMERLGREAAAFVRPSPARGALGGVGNRTREALLLCEAAGFDIVIIETVGVGQSESMVADMTDALVLLQLPHAGDALQAMKKGILELADIVVCNKADLDPKAAEIACTHMRAALSLRRRVSPQWEVPVLTSCALDGTGIEAIWQTICRFRNAMQTSGEFEQRRSQQALAWTWHLIETGLRRQFESAPAVVAQLAATLEQVGAGRLTPAAAAARLLASFQPAAASC